jgi:hypothetical protein
LRQARPPAPAAALLCALLYAVAPAAQAGGHYVPGVEGIQAASVPPPGNYYLGYLVHYDIGSFRAPGSSAALPGSNSGSVTALANRFAFITKTKLLGADYGFEAIVPVLRKSLQLGALGFDGRETGIGDVYLGPVVLGWHGQRWDAVAAVGVWLDNADSDTPVAPGNGYRSTMLTFGGTFYSDDTRTASGSALFRYELNSRSDSGIQPGAQLTLEWGLARPVGPVQLGLVGYQQWQLGRDSGTGAGPAKSGRHALGAEVVWPRMDIGFIFKGAVYREYSAKGGNGPEPRGNLLRVTVIKPF